MKDTRDRIKRRGKAIPMHQNGESVVGPESTVR